jgi:hypothetical protein
MNIELNLIFLAEKTLVAVKTIVAEMQLYLFFLAEKTLVAKKTLLAEKTPYNLTVLTVP